MTNCTFKLRRGQSNSWADQNVILAAGEPGVELNTHRMKVGDGVTPWIDLPYTGISADEVHTIAFGTPIISNLIFQDRVTNQYYQAYIENNSFQTKPVDCFGIRITKLPDQLTYEIGDIFNPTGMIVEKHNLDNTYTEITTYSYESEITGENFTITYTDSVGGTHIIILKLIIITVDPTVTLSDFTYNINEDGNYTLTAWNGKNEELIIPNKTYIIL